MEKRGRITENTTALSEYRRLTVCAGYRFQVLCFAWDTAEGGYWLLATGDWRLATEYKLTGNSA